MSIVKNHTQAAAPYPIRSPAAKKRRQEVPPRLPVCVFYYPGGELLKKKLKRLLLSERGDSSYISSFVYILVAVVLIAFIINVFHIISVKQEMDHMADQLVKQIQLNGGTSGETDALFPFSPDNWMRLRGFPIRCPVPAIPAAFRLGRHFTLRLRGAAIWEASGSSTLCLSTSVHRARASVNTTGNKREGHHV